MNLNSAKTRSRNDLQRLKLVQPFFVLLFISMTISLIAIYHHIQFFLTQNKPQLTVVAIQNPSIVFQQDSLTHGLTHGFAYDMARHYAESINLPLNFITVKDTSTALKWVKKGKAQIAITPTNHPNTLSQSLIPIEGSCGSSTILQKHGLEQDITWVVNSTDSALATTTTDYICQFKQSGQLQQLASFYDQNYIKAHEMNLIAKQLQERMPLYEANFKHSAKQLDLDWEFLAAMGYQESYLDPTSISPTGVRGVMMLTQSTANAMGITDRTDPEQSIEGGAKYFNLMLQEFDNIPEPDRYWYALIAYNMGPGTVNQIQRKLTQQSLDPNQWINMYGYLLEHQNLNSRYKQATQYVKRIRVYVEHIKAPPVITI